MLRRLGIRGKFLAALSVPVLVLFALAGTISMQSIEDVRVARTVNELLGSLREARELSSALQAERDATLAYVVADAATAEPLRGEVDGTRRTVDAAIRDAQVAATSIDLDSLDPVVERAVTGLEDQLGALQNLRATVDAGGVTMRGVFNGYSTVVERVTAFPSVVANALDDRRLASIVNAQTQTMQLVEDYRQEQVLGRAVLDGAQSNADVQELVRTIPATNVQQESTTLTVAQLQLPGEITVPPVRVGLQSYGSIRSIPLGGESTFITFITSEQWYELAGEQSREYDRLLAQLADAAQTRADSVEGAAFRTAFLTISLTVLAVVISIATALTIARQIVEPLRRLTLAAGQVRDELPRLVEQVSVPGQGPDLALARIPVTSRDEVGRLAEAFNEVNSTTIQVAQEQAALRGSIAEMFVNVARRDQVLLNRQLSFIDALERSEEDPATLADLFRLDHLATRMRRNAESLLVLAGIDTGRRLREPLPLSDVIRTASSEIEHYERIHLDLPVDPLMLGHVALPAAHMLAELLENATVFSDPGTPVQVSTGIDETHVIVTVLDQGLGMTAAELQDANARIRTTSAGDVVGAQRLGLFVVGRIAGRLGADVQLGLGPDGTGTLATVRVPVVLFLETASIPLTAPVAAGSARAEQTFAPVEEAAVVVHDTAFAPPPEHVQDVSPGSLGSEENPAEAVDLTALTDGETGHGLPRRRSRGADVAAPAPSTGYRDQDDAAAAPSIPLAPRAEALAGAATLPSDDAWAPAVVEATPLVARRRTDDVDATAPDAPAPLPSRAAAPLPVREPAATTGRTPAVDAPAGLPARSPGGSGLPAREPAASGLPVREPAASGLPVRAPGGSGLPVRTPADAGPDAPSAGPAAPPQNRSAMFSGFRSRRAELAAAAVDQLPDRDDERPSGDGADRLAAAAATLGRGSTDVQDSTPPADVPVPLVIPVLEDDDEYPPSLLGAVGGTSGGRHAVREDDLVWPPAVDDAEDTWGGPVEQEQPSWTGGTAWQQPEPQQWTADPAPVEPVADAQPATWEPTQPTQPTWQAEPAQPTWQAEPTEPAASWPATPEPSWQPEPAQPAASWQAEPEPVPSWAPEPAAAAPSWQVEPQPAAQTWQVEPAQPAPSWHAEPAEPAAPSWEAGQAASWPVLGPETSAAPTVAEHATPVAEQSWPVAPPADDPVSPWSPVAQSAPPVEAPPVEVSPVGAPVAGPVTPPVVALPAEPVGAPTAVTLPAQDEPAKRRWWSFGRGRTRTDQQVVAPAVAAAAVPEPGLAGPVAPAWSAPVVDVPAPVSPAAPLRASAWGTSEGGAHVMPAAEPEAPAVTPTPRVGASAFFPAVHATRDAHPSDATGPVAPPAAPAVAPAGHGWDTPPFPAAPSAPSAPSAAAPSAAWAPQSWDAPEEPQWRPVPAAQPASEAPAGGLGHRTAGAAQQSFVPEPAPSYQPGPTTFTPDPVAGASGFDAEVNTMLAQRADLAQQALAELSQLSAYRPQTVAGGTGSLTRRTPSAVPAAPEITTRSNGQRPERDANQVRSLLSSFQSGTSRGRMAVDDTHTSGTGTSGDGNEEGPSDGEQLAAVPTDSDLTQRSTSW